MTGNFWSESCKQVRGIMKCIFPLELYLWKSLTRRVLIQNLWIFHFFLWFFFIFLIFQENWNCWSSRKLLAIKIIIYLSCDIDISLWVLVIYFVLRKKSQFPLFPRRQQKKRREKKFQEAREWAEQNCSILQETTWKMCLFAWLKHFFIISFDEMTCSCC